MKFFGRKKEEEKENNLSYGERKEQEEAGEAFMRAILGDKANVLYQEEQPQEQPQAQAQETQEVKGEEVKEEELPKDRDEVLIEILKELKVLNSNVKALIVRIDIQKEEMKEHTKKMADRISDSIISALPT